MSAPIAPLERQIYANIVAKLHGVQARRDDEELWSTGDVTDLVNEIDRLRTALDRAGWLANAQVQAFLRFLEHGDKALLNADLEPIEAQINALSKAG